MRRMSLMPIVLVLSGALVARSAVGGESQPVVCPIPQRMQALQGAFRFSPDVVLHTAKAGDEQAIAAVAAALEKACGTSTKVLHDLTSGGRLTVDHRPRPSDPLPPLPTRREGYRLSIEPDRICLRGTDRPGLFYAAQTLRQLLAGSKGQVGCVNVEDWPDMHFRGYAPLAGAISPAKHPDNLACYKRIAELAAAYKLNALAFECEALSDEELRQLADFCRARFIEPIPYHPFLAKNRNDIVRYAEGTQEEVAALLRPAERAIRLIRPKGFGMGGDELIADYDHLSRRSVYTESQRQRRPPHEWLTMAIKRMHAWFAAQGVTMAMWADSLIDEDQFRGFPAMIHGYGGRPDYLCRAAVLLPKDIQLWDWHYEPTYCYPTLPWLAGLGYRVVGCPWRAEGNPELFAEYAQRHGGPGLEGMLNCEWAVPRAVPSHEPLIARSGDAFWSVGRWRDARQAEAIKRLAAENPLLNIGEGDHRLVVAAETTRGGSLAFLVQSAGVKSAVLFADGIGCKGRRTVDADYLVRCAANCALARCRLLAKTNPAFEGSVWFSSTADREDFEKVAALPAGEEDREFDLTERVQGKPLFRVRFRGYNPGKGSAAFLRRIEVDCRVERAG